ncbi:MAG: carbon-nitrogen hydrolase family protein [Candidatus Omnitrophica bacterium]|nr:carbon-nitrogen hydrolase family protein [Candidatus Omnitrophota bacterium]
MNKKYLEKISPFDSIKIDTSLMFHRHKVAAINFVPDKWNKAYNAQRMEWFFSQAAKQKCEIAVAPEGILEGYIFSDIIWHRERLKAFYDIAEPIDGKYIKHFQNLARKLKISFCFGFARRQNDEIFNSAIFIDAGGEICGIYNKLTEGTHPSWKFSRQGNKIAAFNSPFGKCGILICSDRWYPIIARTLALDGAQFFLIPTYGSKNRAQNRAVLSRAMENGLPVVQANVGANLIINKGEIVKYEYGKDKITTGFVDIPIKPSRKSAKACEKLFIECQKRMQIHWYRIIEKRLQTKKPTKDEARHFISDGLFEKLSKSCWGEDLIKWKLED